MENSEKKLQLIWMSPECKTHIPSLKGYIESENNKSGMYGEMPIIKIGKYNISEMSNNENETTVWIKDTDSDEAGQFQKEDLLPILEAFFNSNF